MAVDVSRLKPYRQAVSDNARWADFEPRPNDIFVCTPAKCGTTWTQTIVVNLLWPDGKFPATVMELSPWIEAQFNPLEQMHERLRAQSHRRVIKTHTPADGIPFFTDAKYIFVARDGRDAFMSMCNHMDRMKRELVGALNAKATDDGVQPMPSWNGDVHGFFQGWIESRQHIAHVGTFWDRRAEQNQLLVHFNDLKKDLGGEMRRIARFLDVDVPASLWPGAIDRCTFESMRDHEEQVGKFDGFEGGIKGFIFKGTNGRWRDVLTKDELALYDRRVSETLSSEAAAWMEHGRARLSGASHP